MNTRADRFVCVIQSIGIMKIMIYLVVGEWPGWLIARRSIDGTSVALPVDLADRPTNATIAPDLKPYHYTYAACKEC